MASKLTEKQKKLRDKEQQTRMAQETRRWFHIFCISITIWLILFLSLKGFKKFPGGTKQISTYVWKTIDTCYGKSAFFNTAPMILAGLFAIVAIGLTIFFRLQFDALPFGMRNMGIPYQSHGRPLCLVPVEGGWCDNIYEKL